MNWESFVQKHFVAIVSTHDSVASHGVPIYYYFVKDNNAFYFITKSGTKKHANIKNNKKASLTIFTENPPTVFTANCIAELIDFDTDDCAKIRNKLVEIHSTQEFYPSPIFTLKEGVLVLAKLNVTDCDFKLYMDEINLLNAHSLDVNLLKEIR